MRIPCTLATPILVLPIDTARTASAPGQRLTPSGILKAWQFCESAKTKP